MGDKKEMGEAREKLIVLILLGAISLAGCRSYGARIQISDSLGSILGTIDVENGYKFDTYERTNEDDSHCSITLYFKKDELRTEK